MAKAVPPSELHIAALERKQVEAVNLMQPGPGTPWEDRGHLGVVKAFFATCNASLLAPMKLLHSMRRPDTKSDVRSFAFGCGMMWSLAAVIQAVTIRFTGGGETPRGYWGGVIVLIVVCPLLVCLLLEIAAAVLGKLNSMELKNRAPAVLTYNAVGYALGPSLLAPIPIVGPIVAVLWIILIGLAASVRRMKVSLGAAIINSVLTAILVLLTAAGTLAVLRLLLALVLSYVG